MNICMCTCKLQYKHMCVCVCVYVSAQVSICWGLNGHEKIYVFVARALCIPRCPPLALVGFSDGRPGGSGSRAGEILSSKGKLDLSCMCVQSCANLCGPSMCMGCTCTQAFVL